MYAFQQCVPPGEVDTTTVDDQANVTLSARARLASVQYRPDHLLYLLRPTFRAMSPFFPSVEIGSRPYRSGRKYPRCTWACSHLYSPLSIIASARFRSHQPIAYLVLLLIRRQTRSLVESIADDIQGMGRTTVATTRATHTILEISRPARQ